MLLILRAASLAAWLLVAGFATAADSLPDAISSVELGVGRLFVNDQGLALYTFKTDLEQPGTSVCNFACAEQWPPVAAPDDAVPVGAWSVVTRQDGSKQWAYRGSPVYTNADDTHPDSLVGEKASGVWRVLLEPIAVPPGISISGSLAGQILVDVIGRTLYTPGEAGCDAACTADWIPVEAPWIASSLDDRWTIVGRADGLPQWSFKGQPLYTYAGDFKPGDMRGANAETGWQVVVVQPPPAVPDWVGFQETDMGPVMTDQNRMTLYYLTEDPEKIRRETCDDACVKANWVPIVADAEAKPVGNWSIRANPDGELQWTYLGLPVFSYRHDRIPADISGDKFGSGVGIRGGWRAIEKETLIQNLF